MRSTGTGSTGIFLRVAILMLGLALVLSCVVGNDSPDVNTPTGIGEGSGDQDGWPIEGSLRIIPADFTLTTPFGYNGAGETIYFTATGGEAPYHWDHDIQSLAMLDPRDLDGDGVYERAAYTLEDHHWIEADDTIFVVDGAGTVATATFSFVMEVEEIEEPPALTIVPNTASIARDSSIILAADGGVPPYQWSQSDPVASLDTNIGNQVELSANGTCSESVTVILRDSVGQTATAAITILGPDPLTISPTTATMDANDAIPFTATGGVSPYTWSVDDTTAAINSSGVLSGNGTTKTSLTVTVTDQDPCGQKSAVAVVTVTQP